jgi:hypothetical protein
MQHMSCSSDERVGISSLGFKPTTWLRTTAPLLLLVAIGCGVVPGPQPKSQQPDPKEVQVQSELYVVFAFVKDYAQAHGDIVPAMDSRKPPTWLLDRNTATRLFGRHRIWYTGFDALPTTTYAYHVPAAVVGKKLSSLTPTTVLVEVAESHGVPVKGLTVDETYVFSD